jgi:hypothetical protein
MKIYMKVEISGTMAARQEIQTVHLRHSLLIDFFARTIATMLSLVLLLAPLVAAHGHVDKVIADGVTYQGWNAALKYQTPIPATVGWQADNLDNGFVTPDRFGTVDIVCHKLGKSNGAYVSVKPGSKVTFKWDTWPVSHVGPVQEYIAPCNGDCGAVKPESLMWTKIQSSAWKSGNNPGVSIPSDPISNSDLMLTECVCRLGQQTTSSRTTSPGTSPSPTSHLETT